MKDIHKEHLEIKFSQRVDKNPHLLAVDEIAVKKGHHYFTIILNRDTGQVLYGEKEEDMKP